MEETKRRRAHPNALREGDSFGSVLDGRRMVKVKRDERGRLYLKGRCGIHYQTDDVEFYAGDGSDEKFETLGVIDDFNAISQQLIAESLLDSPEWRKGAGEGV